MARMGESYMHTRFWAREAIGKRPLERPWNIWEEKISPDLKKKIKQCGFVLSGAGWELLSGCRGHGNEISGFKKRKKFFD